MAALPDRIVNRRKIRGVVSCGGVAGSLYRWIAELKFDGYRAQLHKAGLFSAIYGKNGGASPAGFRASRSSPRAPDKVCCTRTAHRQPWFPQVIS